MKPLKIIIATLFVYQIIVLLLALGSNISFGHGLGDLGMVFIFSIAFIILLLFNLWTYRTKNKKASKVGTWTLFALCCFVVFYLTASFTVWRGSEYSWNGEIFYPSLQQKNELKKQESLLQNQLENISTEIKNNPTDFNGYLERARLNNHNHNYEEAINDYLIALKLDSSSRAANIEIGEMYWNLENYKAALKYNERALSIDTSYFLAKQRVEVLREEVKQHSH